MQRNRWLMLVLLAGILMVTSSCSLMRFRPNLGYGKVAALSLIGLPSQESVMGVGVDLAAPFEAEGAWGWNINGGYGFGGMDFEEDVTGDEFKSKLTNWYVGGGLDYHAKLGPIDTYCGPGLIYSSTNQTFEVTGSPDDEFEPHNYIGLKNRIGWTKSMSEKVHLYGEIWNAIGRSSIDDPDLIGGKFSSWQMLHGYNMGLEFRY